MTPGHSTELRHGWLLAPGRSPRQAKTSSQVSHEVAHASARSLVVLFPNPSVLLSAKSGMEAGMQKIPRCAKAGAVVLSAALISLGLGFVLGLNSVAGAAAGGPRAASAAADLPNGFAQVDPRDPATSQQVFLGQPLSDNAPLFPGDPPFQWQLWNCVNAHPSIPKCAQGSGFTLEQIQSLGTHTGTHISAPCHFHEGAICLNQLPEKFFGLRPLIVINVKPLIASRHGNGDFFITTSYIQDWLKTSGCGAIPQDSYVVLYTGLSSFYPLGNQRVPGL